MSLLFIFLCRKSSSGTARSTSLSESFHSLWIKASLYPSILCKSFSVLNPSSSQQENGNTLCWERMQSLTNLIRHTKVSYLIASLLFRRFSCVTYRNGLHRGTSRLKPSRYLRKYEPCYFDTYCWETAF